MSTPPDAINKGNNIEVSLEKGAKMPERQNPGDAGYDFWATDVEYDEEETVYICSTGVRMSLPKGFVGIIAPRSSVYKKNLVLANDVGFIDSGYRGEIKFLFIPTSSAHDYYRVGDRIGQMIIVPHMSYPLTEVESLDDTERGEGGFGSTGNE